MPDLIPVLITEREHATVLNALRFWQSSGCPVIPELFEGNVSAPVDCHELDDFIERFNLVSVS